MNINNLLTQRILVTGITGIHGWPLYRKLSTILPPAQLFGVGPPQMKHPSGSTVAPLCVADTNRLEEIRKIFNPTVVIHAAGVCDLDVCELRPQWADRINRMGTAAIATVFGASATIIYLSADLVYSGNNAPAGGYTEQHLPDPISIAGKTFFAGEAALAPVPSHAIIRLGLPMGASVAGDKGGLDWIEGRFKKGRKVTLFSDEYRSVISCEDCARCLIEFICTRQTGLFHLGGPLPVSLYELGRSIMLGGGYAPELLNGIVRCEEQNGPPRMGNVSLNSNRITASLSLPPKGWYYGEQLTGKAEG